MAGNLSLYYWCSYLGPNDTDHILPFYCQWFNRKIPPPVQNLPEVSSNTVKWTNTLTLVPLGIHTAVKDDLQCTTAELVYGITLHLPGEFFANTSNSNDNPASYVIKHKASMSQVKPPPAHT